VASGRPPPRAKPLRGPWIRVALTVEARVFPLAFAASAFAALWRILAPLPSPQLGQDTLLGASGALIGLLMDPDAPSVGLTRPQMLSLLALGLGHPVLAFVFNAACAGLLVLRTRLRYVPSRPREVLLPTVATFLLLLVSIEQKLPAWLARPLALPPTWGLHLVGLAAALTMAGLALSLWSLLHLRRSFSVFVEVREIVATGPYRHVRHPLYLGEITLAAGLLLCRPTAFGVLLVATLVRLQLLRADMEEARLAEASPEYAARLATTGRLFPRLRRPR